MSDKTEKRMVVTLGDVIEAFEKQGGDFDDWWDEMLQEEFPGISDRTFELYVQSDDSISEDDAAQALQELTNRQWESESFGKELLKSVVTERLAKFCVFEYEENTMMNALREKLELMDCDLSKFSTWDVLYDLYSEGFIKKDYCEDQIISNTQLRYNITLATKNELNFDSTVEVLADMLDEELPPSGREELGRLLDNGLVWLISQQGYRPEDIFDPEVAKRSPFIRSVCEELNESGGGTPFLTLLAGSDPNTMLELVHNDDKTVTFPTSTVLGLFSGSSGGGSILGIDLEKPLVVPKDLIFDIEIEGSSKRYRSGYTVDETYGLARDAWDAKPNVGTEPTLTLERFGKTIDGPAMADAYSAYCIRRQAERDAEERSTAEPTL